MKKMPIKSRRPILPILLLATLAACQSGESPDATVSSPSPTPASAPAPLPDAGTSNMDATVMQMVQLGGTMQAAAEACQQVDGAELAAAKAQQKQHFVSRGGSESAFESAFTGAYEKAREKLATASAPEREQACRELSDMSNAATAGQG
ncbi:hypothetical protein [Marilutibacter spongiae]|uniref:DUF4398 domain-containing protein n=1 Tax=Marilutibacter spongiae TaxID=2025720 RepID=A0A7W3TL87_9GAMM|nr:hypothetical protein [Lysobacter spongiae]MBB1060034.1 hypothetical protein [Lysobacter spongiae]